MENLLSAASHETLPDSFVFPAEQRPPASSAGVALPVIDLSAPRDEVRRAVLEAGKELGFFQVPPCDRVSSFLPPIIKGEARVQSRWMIEVSSYNVYKERSRVVTLTGGWNLENLVFVFHL